MSDTEQPFDALDAAERGLLSVDDLGTRGRRNRRSGRQKGQESALRALKAGPSAILDDEDEEDEYFDEIDEGEYTRRRQHLADEADDFIVDDGDGDYGGYYDDGRDLFDDEEFVAESKVGQRVRRQQRGVSARSRAGIRAKNAKKKTARVTSLFTKGRNASKLGASFSKQATNSADNQKADSLLAEVLGEDNNDDVSEDDDIGAMLERRRATKGSRNRASAVHAALHGSLDDAEDQLATTTIDDYFHPTGAPSSSARSRHARKHEAASDNDAQSLHFACSDNMGDFGGDDNGADFAAESTEANGSLKVDMSDLEDGSPSTKKPKESDAVTTPASPMQKKSKKRNVAVVKMDEEDEDSSDDDEGNSLKASKPAPKSATASGKTKNIPSPVSTEPVSSWQKKSAETQEVKISTTTLPTVKNSDDEDVVEMYWLDAYEPPSGIRKGSIYILGKIYHEEAGAFVSCCLIVNKLERNVFVLKRDDLPPSPDPDDDGWDCVRDEMDDILSSHGITEYQSIVRKRKYAFEIPNIPKDERDYLKIKYLGEKPALPQNLTGKTFSHVFGASITPLERFIMKRGLMGPCWLHIKGARPVAQKTSYCKVEMEVDQPKHVNPVQQRDAHHDPPPLTVISIAMQTHLNKKTQKNEILAMTGLVCKNVQLDKATENPRAHFEQFSMIRPLDKSLPLGFKTDVQRRNRAIDVCMNERMLLSAFIAKLANTDPDVIVAHNLFGLPLDILVHKLKEHKIGHWSKIGRLKRKEFPKNSGLGTRMSASANRNAVVGRLLLDVQKTAQELIRQVSYGFTDLARSQLNKRRSEIDLAEIEARYQRTETLLDLMSHVENDALLGLELMFKLDCIPLMKQITNITGGLMSRTLARGRSDRNEFLLCHRFHDLKYIVPDRPSYEAKRNKKEGGKKKTSGGKGKPQYAGGLVLDPIRGFYNTHILLLDFNSLYPSIILEYKLCFTTVKRDHINAAEAAQKEREKQGQGQGQGQNQDGEGPDLNGEYHHIMAEVPDSGEEGVLPKVLSELIKRRNVEKRAIKGLEKKITAAKANGRHGPSPDPEDIAELTQCEIRSKALKLTANSMYGCLGFKESRFYARPIAELITSLGRTILQKTVELAEMKAGLKVIYGDTDSIMINSMSTDYAQTLKTGKMIMDEVNKVFGKVQIGIDGVYKSMLLLKKKKYAALAIQGVDPKSQKLITKKEVKGLDIVRRDWCGLAHRIGNSILDQILSQEADDAENVVEQCHAILEKVAEKCRNGDIRNGEYIIHKSLTKDPSQYPDKKSQPHVQVALRLRASGISVKQHDTIPYIICVDGTENSPVQRAYHPKELSKEQEKEEPSLKVDIDYYLKSQLHPVVSRLLEPIEGTDNVRIAECLGLDASAYRRAYNLSDIDTDTSFSLTSQLSDEERFKAVEKLRVRCNQCFQDAEFPGVYRVKDAVALSGLLCPNPACRGQFSPAQLKNIITLGARKHIQLYYGARLKCSEAECKVHNLGTRDLSVMGSHCLEPTCHGSLAKEYSDKQLYTQLSYYLYLFDVAKAQEKHNSLAPASPLDESCKDIHKHAEKIMSKSARRHVSLAKLFAGLVF